MNNMNVEEIIEKLKQADDAYFNTDQVIMTDAEYDLLKISAQKMNPSHPYFVQVGSDVRSGKTKLPYPMNGLEQYFQVKKWFETESYFDEDIIVSYKYDGTSGLLIFADKNNDGDAEWINAYSRGNSLEGADISRHLKHMNFPKSIPGFNLFVVRIENIIKEDIFKAKYAGKYSTARAMVAGCLNRTETDCNILKDIDVVAYTVVAAIDNNGISVNSYKTSALQLLNSTGFQTAKFVTHKAHKLTDEFLTNSLKKVKSECEFELDGFVLTENISNKSIKYKIVDESSVVTPLVKKVHYEISKHGYQKPVVEIEPVKLYGTIVTYATGFNCKFINDNVIGPGARVKITKSGSVIPYIMEVISPATSGKPQLPDGDNVWNENKVELVVKNPESHPEVLFKLVLDFFESLNVELLREATLKLVFDKLNLWNENYENIITIIIDMMECMWENIVGANGKKIYVSLHRRLSNLKPETLLGSLKYFGFGFGVRKAKQLLKQISLEDLEKASVNDIAKLEGFDHLTASRIVSGFPDYKDFYLMNKNFIKFVSDDKTDEMKNIIVVFTGFRDSDLEERVEKMGGKVSTGVSKKTNYVISADADTNSGKCKKAKELGIQVLSIDEFKDKFNL